MPFDDIALSAPVPTPHVSEQTVWQSNSWLTFIRLPAAWLRHPEAVLQVDVPQSRRCGEIPAGAAIQRDDNELRHVPHRRQRQAVSNSLAASSLVNHRSRGGARSGIHTATRSLTTTFPPCVVDGGPQVFKLAPGGCYGAALFPPGEARGRSSPGRGCARYLCAGRWPSSCAPVANRRPLKTDSQVFRRQGPRADQWRALPLYPKENETFYSKEAPRPHGRGSSRHHGISTQSIHAAVARHIHHLEYGCAALCGRRQEPSAQAVSAEGPWVEPDALGIGLDDFRHRTVR